MTEPSLENFEIYSIEPSSPLAQSPRVDSSQFQTSTPNYAKKQHQPLNVVLPATAPSTPLIYGEPALTPPPRSPNATAASGDSRQHAPDGTSSDKSSETAVGVTCATSAALSRKESYKAQRQHYRREKKRAASALLHSIEDPEVVVLADWLKVRGSLKSWTKLWCVLKPGLLLLYKSPKAKSSHWVGTVLLASCQVIERPSKKDGFCFKLYHPLEQSIWAPRGPHNESIGAVVQPLPTAHLIFRAPSQAAGHCWLDGLELALRCSNAMLRCSRSRPDTIPDLPATQTNISHEELEKHFNEHVSDYTPKRGRNVKKPKTKRTQFMEPIEILRDSESESERKDFGLLDFLRRKEIAFDRNTPSTSSARFIQPPKSVKQTSKSVASSPNKHDKRPILCFDLPKLALTDKKRDRPSIFEENLMRFISSIPKRRSSTPSTLKSVLTQRRISELRKSGAKTDSENDDVFIRRTRATNMGQAPENIVITKTAPSLERFRRYSSSSTDEFRDTPLDGGRDDRFSLIDYQKLPSANFQTVALERRDERVSSQSVYVAGKIVKSELAGAGSDTDSDESHGMPAAREDPNTKRKQILDRVHTSYVPDPHTDIGVAGELVEEVAEENKSLLWFLLKQVRPGMDLSKVVLPTFILEPRSFLDKLADSYYHADLLTQTKDVDDPYKRFTCVLRWYLSGLYRKPKGLKKPYNPVLGETFRCCWQHKDGDSYTYYVAEQVSHHPPVSAFYVSNRKEGYVVEGSLLAKSKFYGNSTSAILEGCARVHLIQWGETYTTTAPYAHCKGIVIGTLSMELGGKVQVTCNETGYQAEIEFKLRSFLGGADQTNAISGRIKKGKDTIAYVEGYWDGKIDIKDKKSGEETVLLDVAILKEHRMPRYLMRLDQQVDFESQKLWFKVSEAIDNEDQLAATEEKTLIEEAQRVRCKNTIMPWVPRLFYKDAHVLPPEGITDQGWRYNHLNTSPWKAEEIIEYEDDFVIKSAAAPSPAPAAKESRLSRGSDSDSHLPLATSHLDIRRSKSATARTVKQSLLAIDSLLREQSVAIAQLSKTIENLSDAQRAIRPHNVGRIPTTTHSWDIFGGFLLAIVLQALLNWMFYHNN